MSRVLVPYGDRVVVEQAKAKDVTEGGLHLAPTAVEAPAEGVILAVGDGVDSGKFAVGMHVLFHKYAGAMMTVDGREVLVLPSKDIVGRIVAPRPDDRPDITQKDGSPIPVGSKRLTDQYGWEYLTTEGWVPKDGVQLGNAPVVGLA